MLLIRLALGSIKSLINEVLTISLMISLISGAKALTNVVLNISHLNAVRPWTYLIMSIYSELRLVTSLWSLPMWLLVTVSTYLMSNYLVIDLIPTYSTLTYLGSPTNLLIKVFMVRYLITSSLIWATGLSLGLTTSQIVFRFLAYVTKAPYEAPNLYLSDLLEVVVATYVSTFLGVFTQLVRLLRCRYVL